MQQALMVTGLRALGIHHHLDELIATPSRVLPLGNGLLIGINLARNLLRVANPSHFSFSSIPGLAVKFRLLRIRILSLKKLLRFGTQGLLLQCRRWLARLVYQALRRRSGHSRLHLIQRGVRGLRF